MKPQARPFTVEVKNKRRPLQASYPSWSTVIDEPSPDDLPSRDIRGDEPDTPFAAASRVFSAFATTAISSASTLGDLATSVFAPKPEEVAAPEPSHEVGRQGRILPSLLPVNPFEHALAGESGPVRKAAKIKRARRRAKEPTHAVSASVTELPIVPELSVAATTPPTRGRNANGRRAAARVRAGERWKRRRLPKACW